MRALEMISRIVKPKHYERLMKFLPLIVKDYLDGRSKKSAYFEAFCNHLEELIKREKELMEGQEVTTFTMEDLLKVLKSSDGEAINELFLKKEEEILNNLIKEEDGAIVSRFLNGGIHVPGGHKQNKPVPPKGNIQRGVSLP